MMNYLKTVARTGVLFLVYSKTPISILCNYLDSVLVLGDRGAVLYYGDLVEGKKVLFDPYYREEPHYNALDCLFHTVNGRLLGMMVSWHTAIQPY